MDNGVVLSTGISLPPVLLFEIGRYILIFFEDFSNQCVATFQITIVVRNIFLCVILLKLVCRPPPPQNFYK